MFEETLEDGRLRFTPVARMRLVQPEDCPAVLAFGYDAWGEGKTLAEFVAGYDHSRNHQRGTRYLLETLAGVPVAGLNTLRFRRGLMGLASVATDPAQRGKGYSALLVRAAMELQRFSHGDLRFLLFSEVRHPSTNAMVSMCSRPSISASCLLSPWPPGIHRSPLRRRNS